MILTLSVSPGSAKPSPSPRRESASRCSRYARKGLAPMREIGSVQRFPRESEIRTLRRATSPSRSPVSAWSEKAPVRAAESPGASIESDAVLSRSRTAASVLRRSRETFHAVSLPKFFRARSTDTVSPGLTEPLGEPFAAYVVMHA